MRRSRALLLVPAALAALGACGRCGGSTQRAREGPRPVALVNGEPIAAEVLRRELAETRAGEGEGGASLEALKKRLLEDHVDRLLLLQEAKARSVSVSQEQVERAFLGLRTGYPGTHFDDQLAQERLSASEVKAQLREQLTIEKLFASEVFPGVSVADGEIERAYQERAAAYDLPEQVHAFQVVVRTKEEAARIRGEIRKSPQKFGEVARRASIAPEGRKGGDLGWFGKGSGMPEVFDTCFKLPLDTLSQVTPSPYGFHVFKVVARRPASRRPFAEVKGELREQLLRDKRARAQEEYVAALRKKARIQIDSAALDAVAP